MSDVDAAQVGLCARCRHARIIETPRSRFWLCERSRHDTTYARYPRLPILSCRGFEAGEPGLGSSAEPATSEPSPE